MRIDDQKPNASEQANRDDRNRQNVKQKDPVTGHQASQQAGQKQNKDFQSLFDQALEKTRSANKPSQSEAAKFDSKIKDILSSDDKGKDHDRSDRKKDKDEDKKSLSSEEKDSGKTHKEGGVKDKIIGKHQTGGDSKGGGSSSSGNKGDSSHSFSQGQQKNPQIVKVENLAPSPFQVQQSQNIQASAISQSLQQLQKVPPQVIDQIVQYVRVGLNKNMDKEVQIDLSDKVFKGLSLRIALHVGKLEITFLTSNADVRRLFEASKGDIGQALQAKGHQIASMQVKDFKNA